MTMMTRVEDNIPAAHTGATAKEETAFELIGSEQDIDTSVFGRPGATVTGFKPGHFRVPQIKAYYHFPADLLEDFCAFWEVNDGGEGFLLFGDAGVGKTSFAEQFAARINAPFYEVVGDRDRVLDDWICTIHMTNDGAKPVLGPLALAVKFGGILCINEGDKLRPAARHGLHSILEGMPLVIPQLGNKGVIRPHPYFRLVMTGNSGGYGDQSGMYQDSNRFDLATLDRFVKRRLDYLPANIEEQVILQAYEEFPEELAPMVVKLANKVREQFRNGTWACTFSQRAVLRFVRWIIIHADKKDATGTHCGLARALDLALTEGLDEDVRKAIHEHAKDVFGNWWTLGAANV